MCIFFFSVSPANPTSKMDQNHSLFSLISHFSSLTSFTVIFFFFFFLLATIVSASVDSQYLACVPETCSDGLIISYPFYIRDRQPPFCGYPGFELSCNTKGNPVLQLPDNDNQYIIHQIFYQNQSLRLSNTLLWDMNSSSGCDVVSSLQNLSLPSDRFELLGDKTEVFVLYNCNQSLSETLVGKKVDECSTGNDGNGVVLAVGEDDPDLGLAREECKNVVVAPVEGYGGDSMVMMMRLRSGFLMEWKASNCSICQNSGGKCGFDNSTYHFRCFCPDRPHGWHCRDPGSAQRGHTIKVVVAATVCGVCILIIILAFCLRKKFSSNNSIAFWRKKTENYQKIEAFFRNYGSIAPKKYKYSDIKRMTNSFKLKLGQGGYGGVYEGRLLDGHHVAVKVLNESKGNGEEFINEMASISRTSHVNVVNLLGYCFQGRKRALIYEFVPNGSLEKFIYKKNPNYKQLKWEKLYQIAVGIARGLEYLHRGCSTRILHFDIKPHNILLDEDFCPKISDFGLAKICPRKESIISMTGARGTIGYIAPEIFSRQFGEVSHKSDVYSFEMMVLEMVGGRKNLDLEVDRTSEIYFPHWIYERLEVDEELGLQGIENEEDKECARKMITVSLWCIQTNPSSRPAINRVVEMLEGSLDTLQIPPKPFVSSPRSQAPDSPASASLVC